MTVWERIRKSEEGDLPAIEALYPAAFPDEDLLPLVKELLQLQTGVLSLVATSNESLIGHVSCTDCHIDPSGGKGSLLAPLAVAPDHQRSGVGSALVREGLRLLEDEGVKQVFVLGDPAYYSRFGFDEERNVSTPYEIPEEWASAWQSISLGGRKTPGKGTLQLPDVWMRRELWAP